MIKTLTESADATFSMRGLVALVTGASSGIGQAAAVALAKRGARLILCARRSEPLEEAAAEIRALGSEVVTALADVRRPDEVDSLVECGLDRYGQLDAIVNNAAESSVRQCITDMDSDAWSEALESCLTSVFNVCRRTLPVLVAQRRGSIVNVGSIAGRVALPGLSAYCAAKAGVSALTRSIAVEYGRDGVRCNCVSPGLTDTPMTESLLSDSQSLYEAIRSIPSGRVGIPADPAAAIVYLCTPAASFVNGAEIIVDGGRTAW